MDFSKIKLDKFKTYNGINMPKEFHPPLQYAEHPDVYFVFCESFEQVNRFGNQVMNLTLPKENRVFFVYPKGNKDFHRDHVYAYLLNHPMYIRKAPLLSSLGDVYSCFSMMLVK